MQQAVLCPSCATRLRVPEQALGKRVRCPKCSNSFVADSQDEPTEETGPEKRAAERPPLATSFRPSAAGGGSSRPKPDPGEDYELVPVARRTPRHEEVEETEEGQEPTDEGVEAPIESPKKKKKKKKKRRRRVDDETDNSAWPWLVFGGGGIFLFMFLLFCITVLTSWDNWFVKYTAAYLLISTPVSMVIFFIAMFLSSVLVGGVEIGEIHVTVVKSFILVVLANLVSLIPFVGIYASFGVWIVGLMTLFRLDLWESRILIAINWILNFGFSFVLFMMLISWASHASNMSDHWDRTVDARPPVQKTGWDEEEIGERDGTVEYDPKNPDEDIVIGISFRESRITDTDLAHMKDFPRLVKLDLTNTSITDKGLGQLKACRNLQVLILTQTRVTDAGVKELQQELPRLKVVR